MVRSTEAHFMGRHTYKIDKKGRLALPADFRRALDATRVEGDPFQGLIVMPSLDGGSLDCGGYPLVERLQRKLDELERYDAEAADAIEMATIGQVRKLTIDPEGRTILPKDFVDELGLDGEATLIGRNWYFQIWPPAAAAARIQDARAIAKERRFSLRQRPAPKAAE
ncbi:MAG: division/cell wall cluster transcriptional repressor MraZ [Pseudomonadota bacterium]